MLWPQINGGVKKLTFLLFLSILILGLNMAKTEPNEGDLNYYRLSPAELIIPRGPAGSFDHTMVHTLSIVELNKNDYRFWGYYTAKCDAKNNYDIGLVYSNDLVNWTKYGSPVVENLRWGTLVVADGILNMFGTRNYGGDSYIVRLTSDDGINFTEQETVVPAATNQRSQNPFIYYDETNKMYRLYYFHQFGNEDQLEEKHASDISQLARSPVNLVLDDSSNILAAPSIFYRDNKYWLTAEMCPNVNGVPIWKTRAFVSDNPILGFVPVGNSDILVDDEACFFPYIFDNRLIGTYSHRYADGTWELFIRTHDFTNKNQVKLTQSLVELIIGNTKQLSAVLNQPKRFLKNITNDATWATSDNSVVAVEKGKIIAKRVGSAIITVSYGGASATSHITVLSK